jgi:hypothetical protein
MSNFNSILANIREDFEKYDLAGLINEDKLYQDAIRALKRFGNDMAIIYDDVVEVKGGRAPLPNAFHSLLVAYKCEPLDYEIHGKKEEIAHSMIFVERVTNTAHWSECNSCCDESNESIIRENIKYDLGGQVTFRYTAPTLLRLTRNTVTKNKCTSNCKNLFVPINSTPNEMRIEGEEIHTNFENGFIFLKYYGLPMDDEGHIDIPSTFNGHLENYIEQHLKKKLIERLMINNDAGQGLASMYQVIMQEERISLRNAMNELKMRSLTPKALKGMRRLGKYRTLQYEVLSPTSW